MGAIHTSTLGDNSGINKYIRFIGYMLYKQIEFRLADGCFLNLLDSQGL